MAYTVEYAIERYKQVHFRTYGEYPRLHSNVGWIRINNSPISYRPTEIVEMAERLENRAMEEGSRNEDGEKFKEALLRKLKELENERIRDVWDVRAELKEQVHNTIRHETNSMMESSNVPLDEWKNHINKDTIATFLNVLFKVNDNDVRSMENSMKHFCTHGYLDLQRHKEEMIQLERLVHTKDEKLKYERMMNREYQEKIKSLDRILKEKDEKLKEVIQNSVIFSMDDNLVDF